jgi:hypothetical protein
MFVCGERECCRSSSGQRETGTIKSPGQCWAESLHARIVWVGANERRSLEEMQFDRLLGRRRAIGSDPLKWGVGVGSPRIAQELPAKQQ